MPSGRQKSTCGGKGNRGMFIDRTPKICAAGLPSAQPDNQLADNLKHYLLQEGVDALIGDSIKPTEIPKPPAPLRRPAPPDMRNAGIGGEAASLIHPPFQTKFKTLVEDFKETSYASYWKKAIGRVPDPVPNLPEGLDVYNTTFGMKSPHISLYDLVFPKIPIEGQTPVTKLPATKISRNYCEPPFNPDFTYGHRSHTDQRGIHVKRCLTDDKIIDGTANRTILNTVQSTHQDSSKSRLGKVLTPNNNINNVPKGYAFGILSKPDHVEQCLSFCKLNPEREFYRKCLAHLNTVRKCLSNRFLPKFFIDFYLRLKYYDCEKSGWLHRDIVYNLCASKLIRFDSSLIEPLLTKWQAFDGENIDYKFFTHIINFKEAIKCIPHIPDLPPECTDYCTTYNETFKPDQERDISRMAGVPSGRFFDLDYPITPNYYCKAHRTYLPQESDVKSCLSPSVLALMNVNHRDMYAKREPDLVKKVFRAAGEDFSDEKFNEIWEEAKKYHSQGWVCYETFKKALQKFSEKENFTTE
ncbi:PREDICTED: EF-hand domain-containing family member B-like [Papilio xuthus]|uniref:EF-hand domain-containing family member B-like n=1 Tax=Papilio xuthus TaxID=66420 RepID=A0AAJ6Z0P3_PAPXU|nr:PREDICTED: EF-hand domain-containing family member B-like [Papilio xuthus]